MRYCRTISLLLLNSKFKSTYNKCIKKTFGYTRRDSMTGILLKFELPLPTLDTVVHNLRVLFVNQCLVSCNKIVQLFYLLMCARLLFLRFSPFYCIWTYVSEKNWDDR